MVVLVVVLLLLLLLLLLELLLELLLQLLMVVVAVLLVMPAGWPVVAVLPGGLMVSVAQNCSVGLAASIGRGLVTVLMRGALLLLLL